MCSVGESTIVLYREYEVSLFGGCSVYLFCLKECERLWRVECYSFGWKVNGFGDEVEEISRVSIAQKM